jgi:Icc-related predicted phosphoesterase
MKIHILSDVHLEFAKFKYEVPECDVVVLAGDIHPGVAGVMWAQDTFGDTPVLYVPGNHEFWGKRRLHRHLEKMKDKAKGSNVQVLYNDAVVLGGVRFMGATMWTDFNLYGNPHNACIVARADMGDYEEIWMDVRQPIIPQDLIREHNVSKVFMYTTTAQPFEGKTVMISHHAPSELSCAEKYRNDKLTPAYASRLENDMLDMNIDLWIHGHIHDSADYMIGDSRVICNPRGYHGHYLNPDFDSSLVVEV